MDAIMRDGVLLGVERRRRWTNHAKLAILDEVGVNGWTVAGIQFGPVPAGGDGGCAGGHHGAGRDGGGDHGGSAQRPAATVSGRDRGRGRTDFTQGMEASGAGSRRKAKGSSPSLRPGVGAKPRQLAALPGLRGVQVAAPCSEESRSNSSLSITAISDLLDGEFRSQSRNETGAGPVRASHPMQGGAWSATSCATGVAPAGKGTALWGKGM